MSNLDDQKQGALGEPSGVEFSVTPDELSILNDSASEKAGKEESDQKDDAGDASELPSQSSAPGTEIKATKKTFVPVVFDLPNSPVIDSSTINDSDAECSLMPPGEEVEPPKTSVEFYRGTGVVLGRCMDGKPQSNSMSATSFLDKLNALEAAVSAAASAQPYTIRQNYNTPSSNAFPMQPQPRPRMPYRPFLPNKMAPQFYSSFPPGLPPVHPHAMPLMGLSTPVGAPLMTPYMQPSYPFPVPENAFLPMAIPPLIPDSMYSSFTFSQSPLNHSQMPAAGLNQMAASVNAPSLPLQSATNNLQPSTSQESEPDSGAISIPSQVSSTHVTSPAKPIINFVTKPKNFSNPVLPESTCAASIQPGVAAGSNTCQTSETQNLKVKIEDIFRYMHAMEMRKILEVCGNVKNFKFVPSSSETYCSCEAQMQYCYQATRAARLLSALTVGGVRMKTSTNISVLDKLSDAAKSLDLDCMVTIGGILTANSRCFKWDYNPDNQTTASSTSPAVLVAVPSKSEVTSIKPRKNLITIRLASSTLPSLIPNKSGNQNTNTESDKTHMTSSSSPFEVSQAHYAHPPVMYKKNNASVPPTVSTNVSSSASNPTISPAKPPKRDIVSAVQTINKKINDRKTRINLELEKVLSSVDLPVAKNASVSSSSAEQGHVMTVKWSHSSHAGATLTHIAKLLQAHVVLDKTNSKDSDEAFGCKLFIGDLITAEACTEHLNNRRLADTLITATLNKKEDDVSIIEECEDRTAVLKKLDAALLRHNQEVVQTLSRRAYLALDVFSFKIEECQTKCNHPQCHDYHSENDRRRDPRLIEYKSRYCPNKNACSVGDKCPLVHTWTEMIAHPRVFRASLCLSHCSSSRRVCSYTHCDTPEMFYHASWRDLLVTGLVHSYTFFTGAVRNLFRRQEAAKALAVVFVSPHHHVAEAAVAVASSVASRQRLKLATVCSGDEDINGCVGVAGTVQGVLGAVQRHAPLSPIQAFIVDDFSTIEQDDDLLDALASLVSALAEPCNALFKRVNKVAVSQQPSDDDLKSVSALFGTEVTLVPSVPDVEQISVAPGKSIKQCTSESKFTKSNEVANLVHSKPNIALDAKAVQDITVYSHREGIKESSSQPSREPSGKRRAEETDDASSTAGSIQLSLETLPKRLRKSVPITTKSEPVGLSPKLFLVEERQLKLEVDDEYKVFHDMPEMHPDYEEILETFSAKYGRLPEGTEDDLWVRFWAEKMDLLQEEDLRKRRGELVEKFKHASLEQKRSKLVSENRQYLLADVDRSYVSMKEFCVRDALDALDSVTDELGVLGPPLRRLLRCARDAGSSSHKAMQFFTSRDNAALLRMCIGKLQKMGVLAPKSKEILLNRTAALAEKLLQYSEDCDRKYEISRKKLFDLDVPSLAKETVGLPPAKIVQLIRKALGCENEDFLTKEELQEVYMSISSIHLKIALGDDAEENELAEKSLEKERNSRKASSKKLDNPDDGCLQSCTRPLTSKIASNTNRYTIRSPEFTKKRSRSRSVDEDTAECNSSNAGKSLEFRRTMDGMREAPVEIDDAASNPGPRRVVDLYSKLRKNQLEIEIKSVGLNPTIPNHLNKFGDKPLAENNLNSKILQTIDSNNRKRLSLDGDDDDEYMSSRSTAGGNSQPSSVGYIEQSSPSQRSDLPRSCMTLNRTVIDGKNLLSSSAIAKESPRLSETIIDLCNKVALHFAEKQKNLENESRRQPYPESRLHAGVAPTSSSLQNNYYPSLSSNASQYDRQEYRSYNEDVNVANEEHYSTKNREVKDVLTYQKPSTSRDSFSYKNNESSSGMNINTVVKSYNVREMDAHHPGDKNELQPRLQNYSTSDHSRSTNDDTGCPIAIGANNPALQYKPSHELKLHADSMVDCTASTEIAESVIPSPEVLNHRSRNNPPQKRTPSPPLIPSEKKEQDSWFVSEVRKCVQKPNLTVDEFNVSLSNIFSNKPHGYVLQRQDRTLAEGLQQLTTLHLTQSVFICALKKLLDEL
ncbi:uncharacterized protein LOC108679099 [Hyalella azteca]|uniref:Uncharacterized protein LOC108679099 n=1 Tax=Hyalella azteca TaxID=294128 RepID=A0A8B7PAD3_HYAAZ|nr:uncharacterized protein LOC108679099 [Hyalella azteca]XP_047740435.1 uncharacterized protein LOC108679099 [Hyalella azteca]